VATLDIRGGVPGNQPRAAEGEARPASNRRSSRVMIDIPVTVFGRSPDGKILTENATTLTVNAHGGLVSLKTDIDVQEPALLVHTKVGTEIRCRVAFRKKIDKERFEIGFEFIEPNPTFWGINFPPEDWNPADRKRAEPLSKPNDPAAKGPKR